MLIARKSLHCAHGTWAVRSPGQVRSLTTGSKTGPGSRVIARLISPLAWDPLPVATAVSELLPIAMRHAFQREPCQSLRSSAGILST